MIHMAECPVCRETVGLLGRRFDAHAAPDGVSECVGGGRDATAAIRAVIREDMRSFRAEIRRNQRYLASAEKMLASLRGGAK